MRELTGPLFFCAVEIHQGGQHRGVQRDVQGFLLVRGDVTAGRQPAHRQVGGGGGRQVTASIIGQAYLALSSHVNHVWNFFLSNFYLDILLLRSHLLHVHSKISKTKPHQMVAINVAIMAKNFIAKPELKLNFS